MLRLADALIVSEARHKTIAGLYRLIVEAPDPSNGADSLRISPWTAEDLRAPIRHFTVADLVAYAREAHAALGACSHAGAHHTKRPAVEANAVQ